MTRRKLGGWVLGFWVLATAAGCSSPKPGGPEVATDARPPRKGRWVLLPPPTGSHVPKRVWMDEDGRISDSPDSTEAYSPKAFEDMQRRSNVSGGTSGGSR